MQEVDPTDLTKPLIEPDAKFGKFEPDPDEPNVMRYVPSDDELERINNWLAREIDQAEIDDRPQVQKKLKLLKDYKAIADDKNDVVILPLVKRAVNQNVAWVVRTIMQRRPIVSVTPDSDGQVNVLVNNPQYGPVSLQKSTEEVAKSLEQYFEYKFRKKLPFDTIVRVAATEAKCGQTPTWIKVVHQEEKRATRAPKWGKVGPNVVFEGKDDVEVLAGESTYFQNVSTYAMLKSRDDEDIQRCSWIAERIPMSSDDLRRSLYNGDFFLIDDEDEFESFIENGTDAEVPTDEQKKDEMSSRVMGVPPSMHDRREVWFFWPVQMVKTATTVDPETGEQKTKKTKTFKTLSFVGQFHRGHRRLMSMIRLPYDIGLRPYEAVFDRKEPFRHTGESLAEDAAPYQKVISQLSSLEIRGAVNATTPVMFVEPGSAAGEWLLEQAEIEPGAVIPRMRQTEVESQTLGERPNSLLGLIQEHKGDYERQFQIGDLQLGVDVPGRTPASTLQQILNQGETQASMFLDTFRINLSNIIKIYVGIVQQYARFGEVIPFDEETKATIMSALVGTDLSSGQPMGSGQDGIPVRFPQAPVGDKFTFSITASSDDQGQQQDYEKYVAFKNLIDADGSIVAQMLAALPQMIQAVAAGQLAPQVLQIIQNDFDRREKIMERISKAIFKDGSSFAIDRKLMDTLVANTLQQEQQAIAQQQQQAAMQQQQAQQQQQQGGQPQQGGMPPQGGGMPPQGPPQGMPGQPPPGQMPQAPMPPANVAPPQTPMGMPLPQGMGM